MSSSASTLSATETGLFGSGQSAGNINKELKKASPPIYVVVVESHQHVLEHIHYVLRKERLLTREWSMLHFDSHPDLACPNPSIPAKACFFPREVYATKEASPSGEKNLYELLDSTNGGIAEWILPLVLAANLRHVHWVKPRIQHNEALELNGEPCPLVPAQLPLGNYNYHVGASVPDSGGDGNNKLSTHSCLDLPDSAIVKVDWPHPYYLEDDCTVCFNRDPLLLAQPLCLQVSELPRGAANSAKDLSSAAAEESRNKHNEDLWALDICLDYFACNNPFLTDLEAKDAVFTRALVDAVYQSRFYAASTIQTSTSHYLQDPKESDSLSHYREDLLQFRRFLVGLLTNGFSASDNKATQLDNYYERSEQGQALLSKLIKALHDSPLYNDNKGVILISMTEEALPNLVMPHFTRIREDEDEDAFELDNIQQLVQWVKKERAEDPFIITVARSSLDGFTPRHIANKLQDSLLQLLHDIYCGCSAVDMTKEPPEPLKEEPKDKKVDGCRFRIVYDYGAWEGSTFAS